MKLQKSPKGLGSIRHASQVREIKSKFGNSLGNKIAERQALKNLEESPQEPKGRFNGRCNVTACQRPGSRVFMPVERAYYCVSCARKMNDWDITLLRRGEQDWMRFPEGLVEDTEDRQR